jgi:hypothetical protein
VNKKIRKLAAVAATAALALQLFAGASSAAVPNATSVGGSYDFGGNGDAGFWTSYSFVDNNLSKLYLKIQITNGASLSYLNVTKNDVPLNTKTACSTATGSLIECLFKSISNTDDFKVEFAVKPISAGDVTATGGWSSTGFVLGDNNSHGDSWDIADSETDDNTLVSAYDSDPNHAAGFGNSSLATLASNNGQSAKLTGLPSGKYASVNDAGGDIYFGFAEIDIVVNGGLPADFTLAITYPKNTASPNGYLHITDGNSQTYFLCVKNAEKVNCFDWDKKTATATLYLEHNGSLRRTS